MNDIVDIAIAVGPAIVVGVIAYYFFNSFVENEDGRRRFLLHRDSQKELLPIRLQAYERLTLFLERISPSQLLLRVKPSEADKDVYERLLVSQIEQEFEHNLSQQIYMSDECWNVIRSAKNGTIQLIRQTGRNEEVTTADGLRQRLLEDLAGGPAPSNVALDYLRKEVSGLFG